MFSHQNSVDSTQLDSHHLIHVYTVCSLTQSHVSHYMLQTHTTLTTCCRLTRLSLHAADSHESHYMLQTHTNLTTCCRLTRLSLHAADSHDSHYLLQTHTTLTTCCRHTGLSLHAADSCKSHNMLQCHMNLTTCCSVTVKRLFLYRVVTHRLFNQTAAECISVK